jgi:hypothetical protein
LIRQLQLLKKLGLIKLSRVEGPEARGRGTYVWEITFRGIIQGIYRLDSKRDYDQLDRIAETHKDKWIIFKEWAYLSKDPEIKKLIIMGLAFFALKEIPQLDVSIAEKIAKAEKFIQQYLEFSYEFTSDVLKVEAANAALWLNQIVNYRIKKYSFMTLEEDDTSALKVLKYAIGNSHLRQYIQEQFEIEEKSHKIIQKYRTMLGA